MRIKNMITLALLLATIRNLRGEERRICNFVLESGCRFKLLVSIGFIKRCMWEVGPGIKSIKLRTNIQQTVPPSSVAFNQQQYMHYLYY